MNDKNCIQGRGTDLEFVNRIYKYIKNAMPIETFMAKFNFNIHELKGILELCRIYGKDVDIVSRNGTFYFVKTIPRASTAGKIGMSSDKLIHTQLCALSDSHLGSIHQQLHLLNWAYQESYKEILK